MGDIFCDEISTEMATKYGFLGSQLANNGVKAMIVKHFGSFEALNTKAREQGMWFAKWVLSMAYRNGVADFYVEEDLEKAMGWLESSIEDGNPQPTVLSELAILYDLKGTIPYQRKAHELYLKAANFGAVDAELNLANSYMCGVEGVVDKDVQEAFKWYKKAADEDSPVDVLLDKDIPSSAQLIRGTCRKTLVDVKVKTLMIISDHYMTGNCPEGKPQPLKAIYYLKKAAMAGHTESQTKLGHIYLTGEEGLPKDLEKAKRWLAKAANNGSIEAKEILDNFEKQGVIEDVQATDKEPDEQQFQQFLDIFKGECEKNGHHPYLIKAPLAFNESMFTAFPESPTAQRYLKAFKLAEDGFTKFRAGNFKEAVKLWACSCLYENTVFQSFPITKMVGFRSEIQSKIFKELKVNEMFFEGLVLLLIICTVPVKSSDIDFESFKIDSKKTMFLKNVIHLIEKNKSKKLPRESICSDEESYTFWLSALYDFLGSLYTITDQFDEGAQAFEKSIQFCPTNYEAKAGFAYCLMSIYLSQHQNASEPKDQKLTELQIVKDCKVSYENERVDMKSFLRCKTVDLQKKAEQMFVEYLNEAPVCDKKYPNCHYHLACMYMFEGNIQKACEWKAKGEDAEEERLPFMEPVSIGTKNFLMALDMLPLPKKAAIKRCSNEECPSQRVEQLQSCPCKQVAYCGRDCQKKDWKRHKKICQANSRQKK